MADRVARRRPRRGVALPAAPPDPCRDCRKRHAELLAQHLELLAAVHRAERVLRENPKNPRKALAELGIGNPGPKTCNKQPTKWGRSRAELTRLHAMFVNMVTAPSTGQDNPTYARTPGRLDLLLAHSAQIFAHEPSAPAPEIPPDALFETDCPLPMTREDALRNVALYAGVGRKQAWNLLRDAGLRPKIDLPSRPPK